jgi:hypothetical protein
MEYNSTRPHLIIPEYGRNVQSMIQDCKAIKDREQRNLAAQAIIEIIGNLNPHLRDTPDYRHKLWDHLFIMSNFELDVDSPFPIPEKSTFESKPNLVPYPARSSRFRHYGNIVKSLVEYAVTLEDSDPKKEVLIHQIACQMKKSYLVWNKDTVQDDVIFSELKLISKGRLTISEDMSLPSQQALANSLPIPEKPARTNSKRPRPATNTKSKNKKFRRPNNNG